MRAARYWLMGIAALWPCCVFSLDTEAIVARNRDAVVTLFATRGDRFDSIQGTGCYVDPSGLVLTAAHAVDGVTTLRARSTNGMERDLTVLALDRTRDLALLKSEEAATESAEIGDAGQLREGSPIVTITAPKGLHASVADGIVSSTSRLYDGRPVLQSNLDVDEGSSGGPVFDKHGRLVGLVLARIEDVNAATLVRPINQAYPLLSKHGVAVPEPQSHIAPFESLTARNDATTEERSAIEAFNRGVAASDVEAKILAYDEATKLDPSLFEAWFNLGVALSDARRDAEAISAYRKAHSLRPAQPEVSKNLGRIYLRNDELSKVLEWFRRAVLLAPDDPSAYNDLGEAQRRLNRLEEAHRSFSKALQLRPDYAAARYNLGLTCMSLSRWAEAAASFKSYLALEPDAEDAEKVQGWIEELERKPN